VLLRVRPALCLDREETALTLRGVDLEQGVQAAFQRLDLGRVGGEQGDGDRVREGDAELVEGAGEDAGVFPENLVHRLMW
jgi:hypothetical protein